MTENPETVLEAVITIIIITLDNVYQAVI